MTSPQGPRPSDLPAPPSAAGLVGSGWAPTLSSGPPSRPAEDQPSARPDAPESNQTTVVPGPATAEPRTTNQTTVLPEAVPAEPRRPAPVRSPRPAPRPSRPADASRPLGKSRRARLALQRIDPWSVFVYSLLASVFLGISLVVAAAVLYAVLGQLGVPETINQLYREVTGGDESSILLTSGRIVTGATVLAAVNVVLITLLSTLSALLYNLCASFTGGIEVTLGERDS